MPMPVSHGLLGACLVAALHPSPRRRRRLPLVAGALLANCADLDFLLVWLFDTRAWHRGFTHSLGFSLLAALALYLLLGPARVREAVGYALAYASHGLLDYATTVAGGGVELLWPATHARFRLGLLGLSEVPSRMSASQIAAWLLIELLLFAPPLAAALLVRRKG